MSTQPTVVIYDRLSRLFAEEAPDHRINACKAYAAQRGWKVVHVATDTNVSGATPLEDRPGMREVLSWLPRVDYVLAAKLDRYARSVLEFERLLNAARAVNAAVITADGMVNPENGELIAGVLAVFAQHERKMITERIRASKEHFRSHGNHLGGLAPYGYMVTGPVNDKRWTIDEPAAAIIRECAERLINHGASMKGLAEDLNKRGVLPPAEHARQRDGRTLGPRKDGKPRKPRKPQQWHSTTLRDVLYTAAVRGWIVQAVPGTKRSALTNAPVYGSDGQPLSAGPEILSAQTWTDVRAVIDAKAKGRNADRSRAGKSLLLHIIRCSACDGPMYRQQREARGKDFSTYVCPKGVGKRGIHRPNVIVSGPVEKIVTADYLNRFGFFRVMRWTEPDGSAVLQLSEVNAQLDRLSDSLGRLPDGRARRNVETQISALEQRATVLEREAGESEGRWVPAGGTILDEWVRRDEEGRRALLSDLGAVVTVRPATPGAPRRFDAERVTVAFTGPAWARGLEPHELELMTIAMDEGITEMEMTEEFRAALRAGDVDATEAYLSEAMPQIVEEANGDEERVQELLVETWASLADV